MLHDMQSGNNVSQSTDELHDPERQKGQGLQVVQIRLVPERVLYSDKAIENAEDLYKVIAKEMKTLDREMFCAVNLSTKNVPISLTFCSMGSIDSTIVSPREVFKGAVLSNAAHVIIAHNHPSSDCSPSSLDMEVTRRLVACGELMGIPVLDHIIVGAYTGEYFSFKEHNIMTVRELNRYLRNIEKSEAPCSIASEKILQKPNQETKKPAAKRKKTR